jgi:tryptophanyl-tRNA synthetase
MNKRVFSGARPTGRQHLGNYLGAIQNYVALQDEYDCVYCVVDLHALTTMEDPKSIRPNVQDMVIDWLAAGMDPRRSIIFLQSHVPQVAEFHLLLSMITPLGWLTRLPTFKEKVRQQPENVNYGLVGYPVLMACDIAIYKAGLVPVGEDQLPHLEFSREIIRRFNHLFGPVLVEPGAKLASIPRVMGIDGVNKMSKSLNNHIELAASAEETRKRVMSMVTDPARQYRTDPGHPEVCNVYSVEQLLQIERDCRGAAMGCVDCKKLFAANLNAGLAPLRERRAGFAERPELVQEVLDDGAARARVIARETLGEVKAVMGLI